MIRFLKNYRKKSKKTKESNIPKTTSLDNSTKTEYEKCEINIQDNLDYFKVEVSTYAQMNEFTYNEILDLISNNISWNSRKQRHNYGTYFIIKKENVIYNILINDKVLRIDERIEFETYTHEKIITYEIENQSIDYFQCKHDINGSSYETLYYDSKEDGFFIKELELNRETTINEINSILNNLLKYDFIYDILDINVLSQTINDILNKKIELTLK